MWRYRGGVGLKDAFLRFVLHTNRDCLLFCLLPIVHFHFPREGVTFTFSCLFVCFFLVLSIFLLLFEGEYSSFLVLWGFTLTLSLVLLGSCNFFSLPVKFVKIGWFVFFVSYVCRRNSGNLESICHPALCEVARFHEGSSTVLASVAA